MITHEILEVTWIRRLDPASCFRQDLAWHRSVPFECLMFLFSAMTKSMLLARHHRENKTVI